MGCVNKCARYALSPQKKHKSADGGIKYDNPEKMVLEIIRQDSQVSARQIAELVGLTSRQVERIIANHKKRGRLVRCGAHKNGCWQIVGE